MKRISLAVLLALMPVIADAAGLGKLTVMSGLGEPFNAEIEISASNEELSSLTARIAPAEAYAEQNVERPASLNTVRVELSHKADGAPILKLSSSQPVNDPFLDMLIQVDWPTGSLLREYTALLDPPGYNNAGSSSSGAPAAKHLPAVSGSSKRSEGNSSQLDAASSAESSAAASDSYVTQPGDTLHKVASEMQVEDVTLEQMLVGLYQANRKAFSHDNMNQLKVGQIIRKPQEDDLRAISPQQALQEVRLHTANWNAYRNDVAQAVAQSEPAAAESSEQSSGGQITTSTEDKAAPPPEGPRDVVKLSSGEAVGEQKAGGAGAGVEDKLRALEEESTSQDKAIAEVNERIVFFEKQIQDMQKLLVVQNQLLADMQKGKSVDAAPLGTGGAQSGQNPAEASQAAQPSAPKPGLDEAATGSSLLDGLLEHPMLRPVGGGILALLVGSWLLLRRQRRKSLDNFEQGIRTSSGLKTDTVFGATSGAVVDTGNTTFMSDFSHRSGDGMIDTSDVDPISEAEVYMAYGRDAQAEEILKDAIAKAPTRYELHLKLLEIYANRKDTRAFETLAGELYVTPGIHDPIWSIVVELGRTLEPGNPMYARTTSGSTGGASAAGVALAAATIAAATDSQDEVQETQNSSLDFDLGMQGGEDGPTAASVGKEGEAESLDFPSLPAFDVPAVTETSSEETAPEADTLASGLDMPELPDTVTAAETEEEINFDFPDLTLSKPEATPDQSEAIEEIVYDTPALEESSKMEDSAQNFDFSLDAESDASAQESAPTPGFDLSGISLDIDKPAGDVFNGAEEIVLSGGDESADVDTKLDLVTAYMDMGDSDGARELLDEVLQEGGPKQRERAQKLLDSL